MSDGHFRPEVVDRDADIVKSNLPGNSFRHREVTNDLNAVDPDYHPLEGWVIRHFDAQVPHRFWISKEGDRKIDCDLDRPALDDKIVPMRELAR
jgi:hypothetical protein